MRRPCRLRLIVMLWLFVCYIAAGCSKNETHTEQTAADDKAAYEKDGLSITHPKEWSLLHDEAGIFAERTVALETPGDSRISLYLYQNSPKTIEDLAANVEKQLKLLSSPQVENYQQKNIQIAGFNGLQLSWTSNNLGETRNQLTILNITQSPTQALLQFHLFDDEIEQLQLALESFINGITFNR
ncbi:MAG TPA: hypothetical protein VIC26_12710 [Marinagarivorans sp.]